MPGEPSEIDALMAEGQVLLSFGVFERAATKFEAVLAVAPDHEAARAHLRLCGPGDPALIPQLIAEAEALIKRGDILDGSRILRVVASDLGHLGRIEQRWLVLARISALRPDDHGLARSLALRELDRGDPRLALRILEPAYRATPDQPDTLELLARCFDALGEPAKAARCRAEASRAGDVT